MPRYNHAFDIAFSVISDDPGGDDVTPAMLKEALLKRIADLDASYDPANPSDKGGEWLEAVGVPFDTYEEEDAPTSA